MSKKILNKVLRGLSDKNIRFNDLYKLLVDLGFQKRVKGGHYIFTRHDIFQIINLQPLKDGKAKAYQVKQVRNIILESKLHVEVF
jgi:predicted RNA binding protein YcfA (HicA-like mRNA interferase family)